MRQAATECWLSTAAIFLQPSIPRNLICPLTTRPKSRVRALVVSGGRSVEPGAEPDEAYEEERTIKAEQNGACDDHIPKLCPTLEAERASRQPHGYPRWGWLPGV
jgi:hypothetical protein